MSKASIEVIIGRIKAAEPDSPIAVFVNKGELDAVFANTVMTRGRIVSLDPQFVGLYHKEMDMVDIRNKLAEVRNA